MKDFYTVNEIQKILKLSKPTVFKLLANGKIKGYKVGKMWRIPKNFINGMIKGE